MKYIALAAAFFLLFVSPLVAQIPAPAVPPEMLQQFARAQHQAIDQAYTAAITKDTTEPYFNSPLTNYLPSSKSVPTPEVVLGDIAGAPNVLPYAEDVYKYFRLLQAHSPRVKVFSIGRTEEGREMIAAAIGDQSLLKQLDANSARLAKLADPRPHDGQPTLKDGAAAALVQQSFPVYYITGTIHSTETGAPTALMELAYRLAVDDSPYIQYIRQHMVVLITPVVEVDGRDRMVDLYKWHLAHPSDIYPNLIYWGHYVAHDNNRDAMALTLDLTQNVLDTFLRFHAQVLHDLHESVPFLYDNTVGDGPYNAWMDPLLVDEWAALGWNNVAQMQSLGMPGVFTHGNFDTWSPGYLMFLAGMHNGISRLYETFGNGGADTERRILPPEEYSRSWFRQNPPQPSVLWSQRDNNNYEQSALLSTLSYFAQNREHFLTNYYVKAKRSIAKPENAGPAAYVIAANADYSNRQLALLRVLAKQHVELSQLRAPAVVTVTASDLDASHNENALKGSQSPSAPVSFPAGSYVIRMDQPFSRVADALLDRQYWSPDDPQKTPYDDTGWSFSELFNAGVTRVTDPSILSAAMDRFSLGISKSHAGAARIDTWLIHNTGQTSLLALGYALPQAKITILDEPFTASGETFATGSIVLSRAPENGLLDTAVKTLDLTGELHPLSRLPQVKTHALDRLPRIAILHTWLATQTEGWWREAFDTLGVPYTYISTQAAAADDNLRGKFDVIVFAPVSGHTSPQAILDGLPVFDKPYGNPLPWQTTPLTPNLGRIDSTPDMRPGLGTQGLAHLRAFIESGGLLITSEDTAAFAIQSGLAPGVFLAPTTGVRLTGSVLGAQPVASSPVTYGYSGPLPVYSESGMAFNVSNVTSISAGGQGRLPTRDSTHRVTGRGGPTDDDQPEDRSAAALPILPDVKPWQAVPLNEEQARNNPYVIPPALRPQVLLRFNEQKQLLLSGLLDNPSLLAERAAVVEAHLGNGNVLLFAINPIYRGETIGSYGLVFNAILNYNHL